jgi:hypothetical protein
MIGPVDAVGGEQAALGPRPCEELYSSDPAPTTWAGGNPWRMEGLSSPAAQDMGLNGLAAEENYQIVCTSMNSTEGSPGQGFTRLGGVSAGPVGHEGINPFLRKHHIST